MVDTQHSALTGASLHEPKGVAAADANRVYVSDGAGSGDWSTLSLDVLASTAKAFQSQLLHVRDEKASGVGGGSTVASTWTTRSLNTSKTNEITGASLASNQITLPTGTYFLFAFGQSSGTPGATTQHKSRLRNITDGATTLVGTSHYTTAGSGSVAVNSPVFLFGRFTIAAQKVFEFQQWCNRTIATVGFGHESDSGEAEVYVEVLIWKVA